MRTTIKLNVINLSELKNFINEMIEFDSDINIHKGSYCVDAKSLLGVLSLDSSNGVDIEIVSKNDDEVKRFYKVISKYFD